MPKRYKSKSAPKKMTPRSGWKTKRSRGPNYYNPASLAQAGSIVSRKMTSNFTVITNS